MPDLSPDLPSLDLPSLDLPSLDLRQVPLSRAGSWLDLSPVVGEGDVRDQVHLVSHVQGMHGVLALEPTSGAAVVDATWVADPSALQWRDEAGELVAVLASPTLVRVAGRGLGLRVRAAADTLTPHTGTYLVEDPVTGTTVFTSYETGRRYRVGVVAGAVTTTGTQRTGTCERSVAVAPDPDGRTELWIEELPNTAPVPELLGLVDEVRQEVAAEFAAYAARHAGWAGPEAPAATRAAYVLWSASVGPDGIVGSPAVLMSKHWMDKVWSWDHCFNALALAAGDPVAAWQQLRLPFAHQDAHGAIPDSVTHSEVLFNFVKPPVHGWAVQRLLGLLPEVDDDQVVAFRDELLAWTRWWQRLRTLPERGLPHYQHGNDSGWDNSTVFADEQLVESADLAAFLAVQLDALADLDRRLGRDEDALEHEADADRLVAALLEHLWDGEELVAHAIVSGRRRRTRSLLPNLALLLGDRLPEEVRRSLVRRVRTHLTDVGLATEPVDSPDHERDGYWRGPVWAPSTVLAVEGLRRCGEDALADEVVDRFLRVCERSGFAENFDAVSGEGLRDRSYTWTASAYLLLARDRPRVRA